MRARRVSVVGLGLMGGSLARALAARGVQVVGYDRDADSLSAAVDEGILQLTKFEHPDPSKANFAKRALGVASYETIGWTLLSQPVGASRRTGGDAAGGLGGFQMVKWVALAVAACLCVVGAGVAAWVLLAG